MVMLKPMRKIGLVAVVVVSLGIIWMAPQDFFMRFSRAFQSTSKHQSGFGDRLDLSRNGLRLYRMHPFFGVGLGNVLEGMRLAEFEKVQVTHSVFVECLAETGIFGFMGFFFVAVMTARGFLRIAKLDMIDREFRIISVTFLALFVVVLVSESSSGSYIRSMWYILFGMVKNMEALATMRVRRATLGGWMPMMPVGRAHGANRGEKYLKPVAHRNDAAHGPEPLGW
ncbi:MAG: hypothetical protein DRQ40_09710 [Gammaproteobacteria bacterium]|nr:MAG: hypothetical protein DRQ40_09710 [Gammaproteobacteria bacterium]